VKSDDPTGCRRKLTPIPATGSKRRRMVCSRTAGLRPFSTLADESVIEAPKPSTVW
jgi:hypothetical protein